MEPQDEAFIRQMIAEGHATDADTARHKGALVWREGAAIHSGEEAAAHRVRIYFQQVPEAKSGKNRVHLDVRTGDDDPEEIRARLVERGATVLYTGRRGPRNTWMTMADLEGNEFCI